MWAILIFSIWASYTVYLQWKNDKLLKWVKQKDEEIKRLNDELLRYETSNNQEKKE